MCYSSMINKLYKILLRYLNFVINTREIPELLNNKTLTKKNNTISLLLKYNILKNKEIF